MFDLLLLSRLQADRDQTLRWFSVFMRESQGGNPIGKVLVLRKRALSYIFRPKNWGSFCLSLPEYLFYGSAPPGPITTIRQALLGVLGSREQRGKNDWEQGK